MAAPRPRESEAGVSLARIECRKRFDDQARDFALQAGGTPHCNALFHVSWCRRGAISHAGRTARSLFVHVPGAATLPQRCTDLLIAGGSSSPAIA